MDQLKRPRTISDLAACLGVSPMTVHRAIAGKPDISVETRQRILAEVERLGWRPNIAARGLRKGKTFTLGILVSNVAASFLPEVLQGVNLAAEEKGYHTFVSIHEHDADRAIRHLQTLQSKGVDGIVHYPVTCGGEVECLNQIYRSTPVVTVMREAEGFEGPAVLVDDHAGGRIAAEHLLSLGHRRLGFLGYAEGEFSGHREAGCREVLAEQGLRLRDEWVVSDLAPADPRAVEEVKRMLSQPVRPTALVCVSDRLAARALQAASALGVRVPEELSIVGYNDDPLAQLLPVALTTVALPRRAVGQEAAALVLGGEPEPGRLQRVVLRPKLVERNSSGPAPA